LEQVRERQVIATFDEYTAAEQAVDSLAARGFPVASLCITGHDLRLVEQVTGRLRYGAAVGRGVVAGALFGVLVGVTFGALGLADPLVSAWALALWGALIGGVAGLVVSCVACWLAEGKRDFTSDSRVEARVYELVCDGVHADEGRRVLAPVV
jgi:hypothetical protein